jgi:chromosome partitioning protein
MFKDKVFETVIPRNVAVEEAHNQTTSLFDYQPASKGAKAYGELADEILERARGQKFTGHFPTADMEAFSHCQ